MLKIHIYKNIIKNIIILNIIIKINIKNIILLNIIKYYYNAGYHSNENDKNSATSIVFWYSSSFWIGRENWMNFEIVLCKEGAG